MFDCYSTLGVSPCAEEKTIKEAYDRLVNAHREMGGNSPEASRSIQKIWYGLLLSLATLF